MFMLPQGWSELPTLPSPSTQITSPPAAPVALSEVSNRLVFSLALLSMYSPLTNPQLFTSCLHLLSTYWDLIKLSLPEQIQSFCRNCLM